MAKRIPTFNGNAYHLPPATEKERKEDISWYTSKPWRELRARFLKVNKFCVDCLNQEVPTYTKASAVHHIVERKERPDLALRWDNLEAVCPLHHNQKRKAKP